MSVTGRSMFRVLRWVGLAAVAPVLWACNARTLEKPNLTPEQTYGKTFQQTINRNVDMLFLVDDSSSMRLSQDNLNRNFPAFMTRLMDPPGLPNIHVAVISSDMGAGDGSVVGLRFDGRQERHLPVHGARHLHDDRPAGRRDLHLEHRRRQPTTPARCRTSFTCIAALGEGGCGFEHQFASITRALGVDGFGGRPPRTQGSCVPTPTSSSS